MVSLVNKLLIRRKRTDGSRGSIDVPPPRWNHRSIPHGRPCYLFQTPRPDNGSVAEHDYAHVDSLVRLFRMGIIDVMRIPTYHR